MGKWKKSGKMTGGFANRRGFLRSCPLHSALDPLFFFSSLVSFSFPSDTLLCRHQFDLLPPNFEPFRLCPVNDFDCLRFPRPGHSRGAVKQTTKLAPFSRTGTFLNSRYFFKILRTNLLVLSATLDSACVYILNPFVNLQYYCRM